LRFSRRRLWRWPSSGMLHRVAWYILTRVSEDLTASTIMMMTTLTMEAVSSSETLVSMYQTPRCNIPEDGHLHFFKPTLNSKPKSFWLWCNTIFMVKLLDLSIVAVWLIIIIIIIIIIISGATDRIGPGPPLRVSWQVGINDVGLVDYYASEIGSVSFIRWQDEISYTADPLRRASPIFAWLTTHSFRKSRI
jgi:hypothetical protein